VATASTQVQQNFNLGRDVVAPFANAGAQIGQTFAQIELAKAAAKAAPKNSGVMILAGVGMLGLLGLGAIVLLRGGGRRK
jgi:hypothetical protein